ncbi:hypothetical protein CEXT_419451 [Caerostris extrusa]|uniref:Uncharacterized protein n=1 Tax=Caerostris extrusa TaxID=172846 RepID=A0AAV4N4R6_CAEEX|nr:hypothetical protein CEXT_419451 [Caerostris extrusa]
MARTYDITISYPNYIRQQGNSQLSPVLQYIKLPSGGAFEEMRSRRVSIRDKRPLDMARGASCSEEEAPCNR